MATILIVDDIASNREYLVTVLRHQGHRLIEAADGAAALDAVHEAHPDLVITDVLMPVMDGYELVRQLRLDPKTRQLPVVFNTAHYGESEARALALQSGVCYVLTKPTRSETVLTTVNRALSGGTERGLPDGSQPLTQAFDREHLRLLTDKLSEKVDDLRVANARLRGMINIGLELASEPDSERMLQNVCESARDLFGASYVTLGIMGLNNRAVLSLPPREPRQSAGSSSAMPSRGSLKPWSPSERPCGARTPGAIRPHSSFPALHPDIRAYLVAPSHHRPTYMAGFAWSGTKAPASPRMTSNCSGPCPARSAGSTRMATSTPWRRSGLPSSPVRAWSANRWSRRCGRRGTGPQRYLDTADVLLLALDLDGRITLINRKGCDLLGWTERELLGRNWIDTCLPEAIRETSRQKFHHLVTGDLPIAENPILTKSGEVRLIEWRNTVLRDDAGHVIGTFSSGADITERHQAIEALRVAEERTRFALQSANVGIWDHDHTTGRAAVVRGHRGPSRAGTGDVRRDLRRVHRADSPRRSEFGPRGAREGHEVRYGLFDRLTAPSSPTAPCVG